MPVSFPMAGMLIADVDYWAQTAINSILLTSTPAKVLTNKKIKSIPGAKDTVQIVEGLEIKNYK